jgi:hypothetical protein
VGLFSSHDVVDRWVFSLSIVLDDVALLDAQMIARMDRRDGQNMSRSTGRRSAHSVRDAASNSRT